MSESDMNTIEEGTEGAATNAMPGNPLSAPVIALLAIALVGLLGLLYVWFASMQNAPAEQAPDATRPSAAENNEPESTTAEAQVGNFQVISNSDEISVIEADLESTNLDALDAELTAIDAELEAAIE